MRCGARHPTTVRSWGDPDYTDVTDMGKVNRVKRPMMAECFLQFSGYTRSSTDCSLKPWERFNRKEQR